AGVILYELLTGATPFSGGSATDILRRQAHDVVVPPSLRAPERNIPPALDRVVLRALRKRPEARFPDAATFARELRAAARAMQPVSGVGPTQPITPIMSIAPGRSAHRDAQLSLSRQRL